MSRTPIVLLGSVFLPAAVLEPLAGELRERSHRVTIVVPPATESVREGLEHCLPAVSAVGRPIVLAHSNAGNHLPVIIAGAGVTGAVFLDAALPPFDGSRWRVSPESLAQSVPVTEAGLLPRWTRWWPAAELLPLFGSTETFAAIDAKAPRVPAAYLSDTLTAAAGWAERVPLAYLAFGDAYVAERVRADRAGWPTRQLPLGHLGMLTDPALVAEAVESLTAGWGTEPVRR